MMLQMISKNIRPMFHPRLLRIAKNKKRRRVRVSGRLAVFWLWSPCRDAQIPAAEILAAHLAIQSGANVKYLDVCLTNEQFG